MTDALREFMLLRIGESEAAARAIVAATTHDGHYASICADSDDLAGDDPPTRLAVYDSAGALAHCQSARRVVGRHHRDDLGYGEEGGVCGYCEGAPDYPCPDLRDLASVWASHPDYQQEWKP